MALTPRPVIWPWIMLMTLLGASALAAEPGSIDANHEAAWRKGYIESRLRLNAALDAVDVEVADDVVYLAGVVSEPLYSALAEQMAISGVDGSEVVNRIVVIPEAVPQPDRNRLVDLTLNNLVRSRFLTQAAIHGRDINVRTSGRVVMLSGIVESEVERELAYWLARNTKGVTRVINKLTVAQNIKSI